MFCINTAIDKDADDKGVDEIVDGTKENKKIINVKEFSDEFSGTDNPFSTPLQQIISIPIGDGEGEIDKMKKLLEEMFEKAYKDNEVVKKIMNAKSHGLRKLPTALTKKGIVLSMGDLKIKNKQLYVKNKMYVPENEALQLHLLQQHHDSPIHSHSGYKVMYQIIQANYFWFEMAKYCKQYASNYSICRHTKTYMVQKQSFFNPLPIPNRKWIDLLLDFVVKLPKCCRRNRVFQHILVVVDRLTKQWLYKPLKTLHTSKFIDAIYCCVFSLYRFPLITVNDRGGQMIAML